MCRPVLLLITADVVLSVLSASSAQAQSVHYVDRDSFGPVHDGSSWCQAFLFPQDALAVAVDGDEIRVANGRYRPDFGSGQTPGDRSESFQLITGVALRGGFAGCGAPDPDARDVVLYETILQGDLLSNDGPGFANHDDNTIHIVNASGVDGTAILDGFTITAGNADAPFPDNSGGGLFSKPGSPTVSNCVFLKNKAHNGAGMFLWGGDPTVTHCTFADNQFGGTGGGGGIAVFSGTNLTVESSLFVGNTGDVGAGMFITSTATVVILNSVFSGNTGRFGGGLSVRADADATLINCTLSWNTAFRGGGISNQDDGNPAGGSPTITNCIFWGNQDEGVLGDEVAQIFEGMPTVDYSTIEGLTGALGGVGNTGHNPMFVDANGTDDVFGTVDDDVRLLPGSTAIDAGDRAAVPAGITTDFDGSPRFVDISSVPDTGPGNPPMVDMGAFEHLEDCNGNGTPDEQDIAAGDSIDCNGNLVPDECEFDRDGDGVADECDNCPDTPNRSQTDSDSDGAGNACDPCPVDNPDDVDGDGVCTTNDNCPVDPNGGQQDVDGDGLGDACDPCPVNPDNDADGDGVCFPDDQCPTDPDKLDPGACGCFRPETGDSDGDGVADCIDRCPGVDDAVFFPGCENAIPTASGWGLAVLALILLTLGKLYFGRTARRHAG